MDSNRILDYEVLNYNQVSELLNFGVDFSNCSVYLYKILTKDNKDVIIDWTPTFDKNISISDSQCLEIVPTYTIYNLLNILPNSLLDKEGIKHTLYLEQVIDELNVKKVFKVGYTFMSFDIYFTINDNLINALYETLLWCIKYKYCNLEKN